MRLVFAVLLILTSFLPAFAQDRTPVSLHGQIGPVTRAELVRWLSASGYSVLPAGSQRAAHWVDCRGIHVEQEASGGHVSVPGGLVRIPIGEPAQRRWFDPRPSQHLWRSPPVATSGNGHRWVARPLFELYGPSGLKFSSDAVGAGPTDGSRSTRIGGLTWGGWVARGTQADAARAAFQALPPAPASDPPPVRSQPVSAYEVEVRAPFADGLRRLTFRATGLGPTATAWAPTDWHRVEGQDGILTFYNPASSGRRNEVNLTVLWDGQPVTWHTLPPDPTR